MPLTLENARNIAQDKLSRTVIDEFRASSAFMDALVFDDNVSLGGGSTLKYVYDRITTYGTADFRNINEEYTAQEAQTTPYQAVLKPLGGTFKLDRVIQRDVKGITNQLEIQIIQKIKGTIAKFCDAFINGDTAVDAKSFDGLDKALVGSSTELVPAAPIDLSSSAAIDTNYKLFMDTLDNLLGKLDGTISGILLSNELYSIMSGVARRSNLFDSNGADAFGQKALKYANIPFFKLGDKAGTSTPIIAKDAGGLTALYPIRIGLDGVHGITDDGSKIVRTYLQEFLEDSPTAKAVKEGAVEMVAAMALKSTRAAGVLRRIKIS